jgi:hypothetical protein
MTTPDELFPPLVPTNEVVLAPDPAFEAECMSEISDGAKEDNWRFKNSILTKSEKWGIVWRIDFDMPGQPANYGLVNRVACWRKPEETGNGPSGTYIAFGQRISPLGG